MGIPQAQPQSRWPSGDFWSVGILGFGPEELESRLGLQFEGGSDGLGAYRLAVVEDQIAGQIWLIAHLDSPDPGTEVRADLDVSQEEALNGLWRATEMDKRWFKWLNPYEHHPWSTAGRAASHSVSLTHRERQVFELAQSDASVPDIALRLKIATPTVAGHLQRIYLKLGVHSRAELKVAFQRHPNIARSA